MMMAVAPITVGEHQLDYRRNKLKSELLARPEPSGCNVIRTAPLACRSSLRTWTIRRLNVRDSTPAHHNVDILQYIGLEMTRGPSRKSSQAPITTDFRDCDLCSLGVAAIFKLGL